LTDNLYTDRISKVIDYIEDNIHGRLRLNELAAVAMFSKYHFHRIFKNVTGETLNDFIKRQRMIKAYRMLQTDKTITVKELTYTLGYHAVANFSRDFKCFHGVSPSKVKSSALTARPGIRLNTFQSLNVSFKGIERIPGTFVVYRKITTGYNADLIPKVFDSLYRLALDNNFRIKQFIGIGYDDPDYTPAGKCKYDACMAVNKADLPRRFQAGTKTLKGGWYAVFYFEGYKDDIHTAWDFIFKEWLLKSTYIPANRPHLEMYIPAEKDIEGFFTVNLCLPIKTIKK
jgi:AraC family transcriptional regulator